MYLSHLTLTNFRNFLQVDLDLPPGVIVVFGRNAQGKTSLLEAIYLLAIARSFRAENEYEMVNWQAVPEEGSALVGGTIEKQEERLRVYIGFQCMPSSEATPLQLQGKGRPFGVRRQIRVSRVKCTAAELVGLVNAVIFSAQDIELVQGPPSGRRRYLDILMSQVDPSYLKTLQRYQRVLHQRNRLLRLLREKRSEEEEELFFWDKELVREGSWIVQRRYHAMALLSSFCQEVHSELTGGAEVLNLEYRPSVPQQGSVDNPEDPEDPEGIEQRFAAALKASRNRELGSGSTVVGPHRDEFKLLVDDIDMGTYASRGQARTLALTLRLAETSYFASNRGEGPIVLLDDVLSEMDSSRRSRVLEKTLQYQQVIITTSDLEPIERSSLPDATYFELESGRVARVAPPAHTPASPHL